MKVLGTGCGLKILKYAVNKERNKGEFKPDDFNLMRVKLVPHFSIMLILGSNAWNVLFWFIVMGCFYKTMLRNPNNNIFGLISSLIPTSVRYIPVWTQMTGQKSFYIIIRVIGWLQKCTSLRNHPLMLLDVNVVVQFLTGFYWPLLCYFITARQI